VLARHAFGSAAVRAGRQKFEGSSRHSHRSGRHAKSASSQEIRRLLTARQLLLDKLRDVELSLAVILRAFGLKLGEVT
jgi:hypothetical protein